MKRGLGPSFRVRPNPMIRPEDIRALAEAFLEGTQGFVVDVVVRDGNAIKVFLDHDVATSIENCIALSRHLNASLDRDAQDFSLDVSSPGLDMPLKLHRQYVKNVGREVDVRLVDGEKVEGVLAAVEADTISLEVQVRDAASKSRKLIASTRILSFSDIASTRIVVSFKAPKKQFNPSHP